MRKRQDESRRIDTSQNKCTSTKVAGWPLALVVGGIVPGVVPEGGDLSTASGTRQDKWRQVWCNEGTVGYVQKSETEKRNVYRRQFKQMYLTTVEQMAKSGKKQTILWIVLIRAKWLIHIYKCKLYDFAGVACPTYIHNCTRHELTRATWSIYLYKWRLHDRTRIAYHIYIRERTLYDSLRVPMPSVRY